MKRSAYLILFGITSLYFVTVAVNIQVPLYGIYTHNAGYGSGITALVFALYILGVLPVMFFLGGISDRIGRKITIISGLILMTIATALTIVSPTIYALCITRTLQGLGFGLSVPAATAYLAEMTEGGASYSAKIVAMMTSLGFGSGSLLTSVALFSGASLRPWSYWLVIVALICCIALSFGLPEKKENKHHYYDCHIIPQGVSKQDWQWLLAGQHLGQY